MANIKLPGDKVPHGYGTYQLQNYTPGQMQLHEQGLQNVGPNSYLGRLAGGDDSFFDEIEAPAKRQFNEQLGGIASRFSGMGTGSRRSSGFQNSTGAAASNFAQDLASQRHGLRRQAIMDLHGMSQHLLSNQPYTRGAYQKDQGGNSWGNALSGIFSGGLSGLASGGPWGGLGGAALGGLSGYNGGNSSNSASFGNEFGNLINQYR